MEVEPGVRTFLAVVNLPPPGQRYQHDFPAPRLLSEAACDFVAVHLRHPDIAKHHVGSEFFCLQHPGFPVVRRTNFVP